MANEIWCEFCHEDVHVGGAWCRTADAASKCYRMAPGYRAEENKIPQAPRQPTYTRKCDDPKWQRRFLDLAAHVATWSKDPSTKVGAVLADMAGRVVGLGYNGLPRGLEDRPDRLEDRPTKYALTVHAEVNAILNAVGPVAGAAMFVTLPPCSECAKFIIQAGIRRVFCPDNIPSRWAESMARSAMMFDEAGVQLVMVRE